MNAVRMKTPALSFGLSGERLLLRGVKDKTFAPTRYVTQLVAPDTVNTMPEPTLKAIGNFDEPIGNRMSGSFDAARKVMDDLTVIGVDLADVAKTLEQEGVAGFVRSWSDLIASVERQVENAGAEVMPAGAVKPVHGGGATAPAPAGGAPAQTVAGDQA